MRRSVFAVGLLAAAGLASPVLANDSAQKAADDPNNWAMQRADYSATGYSKLDQINTKNVGTMKAAWTFSTGVLRGHEGSPLVIGNTMWLHTAFPNIVYSLNLDGDPYTINWKYEPKQDPSVIPVMCCDTVNRGVQYGNGKIFLHQADTSLVALDAKTGKEVWKVVDGDPKKGQTGTGAPIVIKDTVIIGVSGAEFGVRCWVSGYDIETGKLKWRAYSMGPDSDILVDPIRPPCLASRSARTARSRPGTATSGRSVAARPGVICPGIRL
jgi:PQQ-dependent dehydrogenase (methanol/ethanol family)